MHVDLMVCTHDMHVCPITGQHAPINCFKKKLIIGVDYLTLSWYLCHVATSPSFPVKPKKNKNKK